MYVSENRTCFSCSNANFSLLIRIYLRCFSVALTFRIFIYLFIFSRRELRAVTLNQEESVTPLSRQLRLTAPPKKVNQTFPTCIFFFLYFCWIVVSIIVSHFLRGVCTFDFGFSNLARRKNEQCKKKKKEKVSRGINVNEKNLKVDGADIKKMEVNKILEQKSFSFFLQICMCVCVCVLLSKTGGHHQHPSSL